MNLTTEKLNKLDACKSGVAFFESLGESDIIKAKEKAFKSDYDQKYRHCNWLISRLLNNDNKIKYAIFAALQVIDIFEKKYPDDKRPRMAIEAAETYLKLKTARSARSADAAARSAYAAAYADADADADAYAAAYAARSADAAARSAYAAAYADAYADAYAARSAYAAAHAAADARSADAAARSEMSEKIINCGIELLLEQEEQE